MIHSFNFGRKSVRCIALAGACIFSGAGIASASDYWAGLLGNNFIKSSATTHTGTVNVEHCYSSGNCGYKEVWYQVPGNGYKYNDVRNSNPDTKNAIPLHYYNYMYCKNLSGKTLDVECYYG